MLEKITKRDRRTNLEKEIDEVLKYMETIEPDTDEYKKITENLERLYKMKVQQHGLKVSPDTIALGIFGILQMVLLLNYEKTDVVTSKAFNYIWKGKV